MDDIARVGLGLDTTELRTGRDQAVRSFDDIMQKASAAVGSSNALETALRAVGGAAKLMALAFGGMEIYNWIRGSIELAARYDTLGVVLRTVGQSAGYANGFLDQLTQTLEKTGISMKESRQVIVTMIQAHMDLAQAAKLARVAQNAAVTAGLNSSDTLQRMIYGIQAQQTRILRDIGLNVNFDDGYKKLAATLGKTVDQLTETERASARVNAVMKAGDAINGAYAASMDTASKQMRSMERYVEDLRVKLGELFQPAYTAAVFAFADGVKYAGENLSVVLPIMAALIARGMVPLAERLIASVGYLQQYVRGIFLARDAQFSLLQVNVSSAESALAHAQAVAAESAAQLASAATAEEAAVARVMLTTATLEAVAAGSAAVVATEALAVAQAEATVSTTLLAFASRGAAVALGLLGGPIGIAILATAAAVTYLATQTSIAADVARDHAEALDEVKKASADARLEFEALAVARKQALHATETEDVRKLRDQLLESKKMLGVTADDPQIWGVADKSVSNLMHSLEQLSVQYSNGSLSEKAAYEQLVQLGKQYPEHLEWLDRMWNSLNTANTAQLALNQELAKGAAVMRDNSVATSTAATSLDQYLRKLAEARDRAAQQRQAYGQGGVDALESTKRAQSVHTQAETAFGEYAKSQGDPYMQTLRYDQLGGMDDLAMSKFAVANAPSRPGSSEYNNDLARIVKQLIDAKKEAKAMTDLIQQTVDAEHMLQEAEEAHQRAVTLRDTRAEAANARQLSAAIWEGTAAYRASQVAIAGETAARQAGDKASKADRDAARQAAEDRTRAQQAQQTQEGLHGDSQSLVVRVSNAQRLAAATLQGAAAVRQANDAIEVETLLRKYEGQGVDDQVAKLRQLLLVEQQYKQQATIGKASYDASRQAGDQRLLVTAYQQGSVAVATLNRQLALRNKLEEIGPILDPLQQLVVLAQLMGAAYGETNVELAKYSRSLDEQINQLSLEIAATNAGAKGLQEYAIQQAITDEVAKLGRPLRDDELQQLREKLKLIQQLKTELGKASKEEQTAQQTMQAMLQDLQKSFADLFTQALTKGIHDFSDFADQIKQIFLRLISELIAQQFIKRVLDTASGAASAAESGGGSSGGGSSGLGGLLGAGKSNGSFGKVAGAALGAGFAGFGLGYGLSDAGSATGSAIKGTLGGGLQGAMLGAQVAGPLGAAVGGVVGAVGGLVGGLLGHSAKAKAAAKQFKIASDQFENSFAALAASVNNNKLAEAIAQAKQQFESMRLQAEQVYSGRKHEAERNQYLAQLNALEAQRIAQLKDEYAIQQRNYTQDLQVRLLRAQHQDYAATMLELENQQQREYEDAVKNHTDAATLALLKQVQAQELLAAAASAATGAMLNVPEGFKVQLAMFNAITGRPDPNGVPGTGYRNGQESVGAANAQLLSNSDEGTTVLLEMDGNVVAKGVVKRLKQKAQDQFGDSTRWAEVSIR